MFLFNQFMLETDYLFYLVSSFSGLSVQRSKRGCVLYVLIGEMASFDFHIEWLCNRPDAITLVCLSLVIYRGSRLYSSKSRQALPSVFPNKLLSIIWPYINGGRGSLLNCLRLSDVMAR